jgi:hypothetical protein
MKKLSAKSKRKARKHFILYNNGGVLSATTPKDWARGHRDAFPNKSFNDSATTPIVDRIEDYLIRNLNYNRVENDEIVICYPFKDL